MQATGTGIFSSQDLTGSSDINIAGSNVNAGTVATTGDLNLIAQGEVNIVSGQNTSQSYSESSKKGATVRKSSKDIDVKINNVASNINAANDINIQSGSDTNIIASNLSGTNGNIIVGRYIDPTTTAKIINDNATLTIKAGEDLHYNYHEEMKIKTDSTAVVVGVVAAVAVTALTAGTGAVVMAGAVASGAATGAQGKKGKTTTVEMKEITQISSNLNFTGDLNTQSSGNTEITSSNLSADNATIFTGKFRDQNTGIETIVNADSKLKLESAFDTKETHTTVERVRPNYVGIAVVAGGMAALTSGFNSWLVPKSSPGLLKIIAAEGALYTGYSLVSNLGPNQKSFMDPLFNIRSESSSSSYKQTEVKTNFHFNNLITQ